MFLYLPPSPPLQVRRRLEAAHVHKQRRRAALGNLSKLVEGTMGNSSTLRPQCIDGSGEGANSSFRARHRKSSHGKQRQGRRRIARGAKDLLGPSSLSQLDSSRKAGYVNPDYFTVDEATRSAESAVPVAPGVAANVQEAKWTLVPEDAADYDEEEDEDDNENDLGRELEWSEDSFEEEEEELNDMETTASSAATSSEQGVISQQPLARTISPTIEENSSNGTNTAKDTAAGALRAAAAGTAKGARAASGSRPWVGPSLVALLDQLHGDFLVLARRSHLEKERSLAAKRSQTTSASTAAVAADFTPSSSSSSSRQAAAQLLLESRRGGLRQTLDSGRHGSTDLGDDNDSEGLLPRVPFHLDPPSSFQANSSRDGTKNVGNVDSNLSNGSLANSNANTAAPASAASTANAPFAMHEPFVPRVVSDGHRLDWLSFQALLEPARLMALAANPHLPPGKVAAKFDFAVASVFRAFKVIGQKEQHTSFKLSICDKSFCIFLCSRRDFSKVLVCLVYSAGFGCGLHSNAHNYCLLFFAYNRFQRLRGLLAITAPATRAKTAMTLAACSTGKKYCIAGRCSRVLLRVLLLRRLQGPLPILLMLLQRLLLVLLVLQAALKATTLLVVVVLVMMARKGHPCKVLDLPTILRQMLFPQVQVWASSLSLTNFGASR